MFHFYNGYHSRTETSRLEACALSMCADAPTSLPSGRCR
jgi:hypothetical protein